MSYLILISFFKYNLFEVFILRLLVEILFRIVSAILMLLFWRFALEMIINGNIIFIFLIFLALVFTFKTFE